MFHSYPFFLLYSYQFLSITIKSSKFPLIPVEFPLNPIEFPWHLIEFQWNHQRKLPFRWKKLDSTGPHFFQSPGIGPRYLGIDRSEESRGKFGSVDVDVSGFVWVTLWESHGKTPFWMGKTYGLYGWYIYIYIYIYTHGN